MYKKIAQSLIVLLRAACNGFMIVLYLSELFNKLTNTYVIGRTRRMVTYEKDFEVFNEKRVMYFLFLNNTSGALDAIDSKNKVYMDADTFCKGDNLGSLPADSYLPEFYEDSAVLKSARDNLASPFIVFAEVFIILMMTGLTILNTFWISYYLKPYHIPLFLRGAKTSEWFDRIRVGNSFFTFIWLLSGCMPNLNFVEIGNLCLKTTTS